MTQEKKQKPMTREEYQRCLDSPSYFFNNYVLIKDAKGNLIKPKPVTEKKRKQEKSKV